MARAATTKAEWSEDRELAERVLGGESRAAEELARKLLPRVRNLTRYLVRGDQDVDDLAQSALLEVLRSLQSYGARSSLAHWASRIVVRSVRANVKRRSSQSVREQEMASLRVVRSRPSTPYAARRDVARALDGIPRDQREALVMFHVLGMTLPEVAAETGVSENTAKSRIRLAAEKMRVALGENDR